MDTALELRIAYDRKEPLSSTEVDELHAASNLLARLTSELNEKPLFAVWRLIALSEIPYSNRLEYTNRLAKWALDHLATGMGFSVLGGAARLLPCYNSMLVYSLSKLGFADHPEVSAGVEWILDYQPFFRNHDSVWNGIGVRKYGGCLKPTPCFIGVAKAVKALQAYRFASQCTVPLIDEKINAGVSYILEHHLYRRLSSGEPITTHILDLSFPESYNLNILELLQIVDSENKLSDARTDDAFAYLLSRQRKETANWKVNFVYKSPGYLSFDGRSRPGDWISYLINRFLSRRENSLSEF